MTTIPRRVDPELIVIERIPYQEEQICTYCLHTITQNQYAIGHIKGLAKHVFHIECSEWLIIKGTCPECRKKINFINRMKWLVDPVVPQAIRDRAEQCLQNGTHTEQEALNQQAIGLIAIGVISRGLQVQRNELKLIASIMVIILLATTIINITSIIQKF